MYMLSILLVILLFDIKEFAHYSNPMGSHNVELEGDNVDEY
jgi:hypothetical protein